MGTRHRHHRQRRRAHRRRRGPRPGTRGSRDGLVDELTAFIPFNLRPLDQPLPARLGNRFGLVFLRLPLGIGSRRKRLTEIHRRMEEIKHSPEGALSYGLLGAIGRAPAQVERLVVEQFTAKATAVMTNVPGPRRAVYFAGRPVRGVLVAAIRKRPDQRLDLQLRRRDHGRSDGRRGSGPGPGADHRRVRA